MKRALITGISGQDGPYLSEILLKQGYKVYGIIKHFSEDNLANLKYLGIEKEIELVQMNLRMLSEVKKLLDMTRPDEIYNLAAQSSVGLSFQQPIETVEFNVMSTLNLLEAIRTSGLKTRFYQASSSEMFGAVKKLPVSEETVLHPVSPYAISKATDHWLTVNYREAYGLFSCCGILFNHESVLRGQTFVTKKVLSTAVRISRGSKEKLTLGNTSIQRDWGYAPEYVQAMWLMLQQDEPDDYIIATNEAHSLQEFVELVFKSLKLDWKEHVKIDKALYRTSDIKIIYGNPQKAKKRLGWKYEMTFSELIKTLVKEELACQKGISEKN